jgi:hypothetical protein
MNPHPTLSPSNGERAKTLPRFKAPFRAFGTLKFFHEPNGCKTTASSGIESLSEVLRTCEISFRRVLLFASEAQFS